MKAWMMAAAAIALVIGGSVACSSDADELGIAAECSSGDECATVGDKQLKCLALKGGYCGLDGCTDDAGCPENSACVKFESVNYCFRVCTDKPECNANRTTANEANCVGSAEHVGTSTAKVCVPPSST